MRAARKGDVRVTKDGKRLVAIAKLVLNAAEGDSVGAGVAITEKGEVAAVPAAGRECGKEDRLEGCGSGDESSRDEEPHGLDGV